MSKGYMFKCEKCGYKFTAAFGVGFLYPKVYQETRTAALNGELGKEIQKFLQENPDGEIDSSKVLGRCTQCGHYEIVKDLTMYLPNENFPEREIQFPVSWELQDYYKIFAKYHHECENCGGELEIFKATDLRNNGILKCPHCRESLILKKFGYWD